MKKRIIISAVIIFASCFIFAVLFYNKFYPVTVTAEQISREYAGNKSTADQKYKDKNLQINGNVKAFYKLFGSRNVLELHTGNPDMPVFCFFLSPKDENIAGTFNENQNVNIKGRCVGIDDYTFVKGIKIEVNNISGD